MRSHSITLHYGREIIPLNIREGTFVEEAGMFESAPATDPAKLLSEALDAPTGTLPVQDLARGKRRVVILVDDLTRPTPTYQLLPAILDRLHRAGVSDDSISILVATGTHRPMTTTELRAKLGVEVFARYSVTNHDFRDERELVHLGVTPSGIPVNINRKVIESDCVIGVGNIVPHRFCGWSGGAKIIQPGVCGEATTAGTHLMVTKYPEIRLGVTENKVRHEMEAIADRAHLAFIVNTVLDRRGNILGVVGGDFRQSFRQGVELARETYGARLQCRADIVLTSSYPSDLNFWQAGKGLYAADEVVKQGGIIILASPCYEGLGEHEEILDLFQHDYPTVARMIAEERVKDKISAAIALGVALVKARAAVWVATERLSEDQVGEMGMSHFHSVQEAVNAAIEVKGPAARLAVLHDATEILPVLQTE